MLIWTISLTILIKYYGKISATRTSIRVDASRCRKEKADDGGEISALPQLHETGGNYCMFDSRNLGNTQINLSLGKYYWLEQETDISCSRNYVVKYL